MLPFSRAPCAAHPLIKLVPRPIGTVSNTGADKATSGLKECQQVGVELVSIRIRETVGRAGIDL
jgi:hypothetical protein